MFDRACWRISRLVAVFALSYVDVSWAQNFGLSPVLDLKLPSSNSTFLKDVGVSCASGREATHNVPVASDTCLRALTRPFGETPANIIYTKRWGTTTYHGTGSESADITVPKVWESSEGGQAGKCYMLVSSMKKGSRGVIGADAAEFSLLGAVYYASLVLERCVKGQKTAFGGRFTIKDNSFYIDVTGKDPTRLSEIEVEDAENMTAIYQA